MKTCSESDSKKRFQTIFPILKNEVKPKEHLNNMHSVIANFKINYVTQIVKLRSTLNTMCFKILKLFYNFDAK